MEETKFEQQAAPAPACGLLLTPEAQYYLNEGAGWAKFLGIIGFVFCGVMLMFAVFAGTLFAFLARMSPSGAANPTAAPGMGIFVGIFYALLALLYFFPALYMYQFGTNAKAGISLADAANITHSVSKLKSCLKFIGILVIIGLAFSALGIFGIITALHNIPNPA